MFHGTHFMQQEANHRHCKCESKHPGLLMSKTGLQIMISRGQGQSLAHSEAPSPAQGLVPGRRREARVMEREKNKGRGQKKCHPPSVPAPFQIPHIRGCRKNYHVT